MKKISSSCLSFVVQGPICGDMINSNKLTHRLCESIRTYYPSSEIVISTWTSQRDKISDLSYDQVIFTDDLDMTYIQREDGKLYPNTVNHEIITSFEGIKCSTKPYIIKIRSDMVITNNHILNYLNRYNCYDMNYKVCKNRILVLPTYDPRKSIICTYNICDWIYCGTKEDLYDLFDIPLMDMDNLKIRPNETVPYLTDNLGAEQYIWMQFLTKHGVRIGLAYLHDPDKIEQQIFVKSIANNLVLLPASKMGVNSQKTPSAGYAATPILSAGFYTFCQWKRMYNKCANGDLWFVWNPIEDLLYDMILRLRLYYKGRDTKLYDKAIKIMRGIRNK